MLSRLPISLAQLKAGSISEKHKNKVRQLFYSWDRSKKLTKQLYKRFYLNMDTVLSTVKTVKPANLTNLDWI